AGDAGRRNQESAFVDRAHLFGKGREDREDRALGHAKIGVSCGEAPRRNLRLPADSDFALRIDRGAGATAPCAGCGDQIFDDSAGRGSEAAEKIAAQARAARGAASAADDGSGTGWSTRTSGGRMK